MSSAGDGYSKVVVDTRLQAVRKLDATLMSAIKISDSDLIQVSCFHPMNFILVSV